jgi:hypothetical protein
MDMGSALAKLIISRPGEANAAGRSSYNRLFCEQLIELFDHKAGARMASGQLKGVSE